MLNLKNLFRPPETKTSRTAQVLAFESGGRARWSPRDYAGFAREGYLANAIVHRSVRLIAENAASCAFLLYEGAQERDDHPLLRLITRPNARQDGASFFEALYAHMLLAGNAYVEAVALDGEVRELYALRPDRMKVVPGSDGWAEAYDYSVGGRSVRFDQAAAPVPPILHLTFFHPLDDHYGLAPIEAAAVAVDAAVQIGVLDTALTAPPSSPAEGARYIVAAGATGGWADHDSAIAAFEDSTWRFLMPKLGWCAWSAVDEVIFVFDGAAWRDLRDLPVTLAGTSRVGVNATASDPNLLTVHSNASLFYAIAAADGGSGDARLQIAKESSTDTASVVFSDNFSGRAEFGLVGSNAFKLKVSDDGASFVEALAIDQATGNATLPRSLALTGVIAPPQLTGDEDDYAASGSATASVIRFSADAVRGITGLADGSEGRVMCLINTGAFAVILRDENAGSSATNRFGFGSDLTLGAKQGALLIYDGNAMRWRQLGGQSTPGGGGSAGATDTERQNALLALAYQSKSFGEYRRLVNLFVTGFKGATDAANGIDAGSSSNYVVTSASGYVAATATTLSRLSGGTATMPLGGTAADINDGSAGTTSTTSGLGNLAGASVASRIIARIDYGSSRVISKIEAVGYKDNGAGTNAGHQLVYSTDGTNWTQLGSSITTNQTATTFSATGNVTARYIAVAAAAINWSTITASLGGLNGYIAVPDDMTLVTVPQATDLPAGSARVLIEFDDIGSPALNTDLVVEVTCDGGSNWTTATLSAVTSCSQGGRKVAETADTACTPGTSFGARLTVANGKTAGLHGLTLAVH